MRDEYITNFTIGKWFVALYYRASPKLVRFIRDYSILRALMRGILDVIVELLSRTTGTHKDA